MFLGQFPFEVHCHLIQTIKSHYEGKKCCAQISGTEREVFKVTLVKIRVHHVSLSIKYEYRLSGDGG